MAYIDNKRDNGLPLVSVCCLTYNHRDTIARAIEGVISQKTDFPFELIIHDDASSDGTADIVRDYAERYPDIIRPILQTENQFFKCNLAERYLRPMLRGKYVAICEGDDFWTDDGKLRRQVERMESDPGCAMCFHAVTQLSPDGSEAPFRPLKADGEVPAELIIKRGGMFCPTVSLMVRRDVADLWPDFRLAADVYDYPLQVLAADAGKVCYIDRIMGVYRFSGQNSWTAAQQSGSGEAHLNNETDWLCRFNEYSGRRHEYAVNYHLTHLWFTEYRRTLSKAAKRRSKEYCRSLKLSDRIVFGCLFAVFGVFGKRANRLFESTKKYLLK